MERFWLFHRERCWRVLDRVGMNINGLLFLVDRRWHLLFLAMAIWGFMWLRGVRLFGNFGLMTGDSLGHYQFIFWFLSVDILILLNLSGWLSLILISFHLIWASFIAHNYSLIPDNLRLKVLLTFPKPISAPIPDPFSINNCLYLLQFAQFLTVFFNHFLVSHLRDLIRWISYSLLPFLQFFL